MDNFCCSFIETDFIIYLSLSFFTKL